MHVKVAGNFRCMLLATPIYCATANNRLEFQEPHILFRTIPSYMYIKDTTDFLIKVQSL